MIQNIKKNHQNELIKITSNNLPNDSREEMISGFKNLSDNETSPEQEQRPN